jgi:hypothetical protein
MRTGGENIWISETEVAGGWRKLNNEELNNTRVTKHFRTESVTKSTTTTTTTTTTTNTR